MIPLNTPPTVPTNPRWMWLLIGVTTHTYEPLQGATMFFPLIPNTDPSPGDDPNRYCTDLALQLLAGFAQFWPESAYMWTVGFYWQTARGLNTWLSPTGSPLVWSGTVPFTACPGQVNAVIRKRTARYPLGLPYFRIPLVPLSFYEDGHLSPLGFLSLKLLADVLNTNLNSQGVQFAPASWSSFSNAFEPVLDTFAVQPLSRQMRRGIFRSFTRGVWIDNLVWLY